MLPLNFSTVTYLTANAAGLYPLPSAGAALTWPDSRGRLLLRKCGLSPRCSYRLPFYGRIPFGWLVMKYMERKDSSSKEAFRLALGLQAGFPLKCAVVALRCAP